jgi:methyl-accepting chemotaxis protein
MNMSDTASTSLDPARERLRLSSVSVRIQLMVAFGVLIIAAAGAVFVAVRGVNSLDATQERLSEQSVPHQSALAEAALAAKSAANDERGFLLTGEAKYADEARGRRAKASDALAQAKATAESPAELDAVERIATDLARFQQGQDEVFALYATDRTAALKLAGGANRDLRKAYETDIDEALKLAKEQVEATSAAGE